MYMPKSVSLLIKDIELLSYQDVKSRARIVVRNSKYYIQHFINGQWHDSKEVTKEEIRERHPILGWLK